jgi:hypothetical protein
MNMPCKPMKYLLSLSILFLCANSVGHTQTTRAALDLPAEWRREFADLEKQMGNRAWCQRVASQTENPAALIAPADRDPLDVVLRRSRALLDYLSASPKAPDLSAEAADLESLTKQAAAVAPAKKKERRALYEKACALRRRIAFRNPLLDFDRLLFLTKHRPMRGDWHMVDQYYGFNARPGGSLYVLEGPFGDSPRARDLLAGAKIANGRLAGRPLAGGAFNTLELDYDGETIAFAWSECGEVPKDADWSCQPWSKDRASRSKKPFYYWSPETSYHVFKMHLGSKKVVQLTDGRWQDFDPCFLPNGRIAFISERRGGFLRCGGNRPNPTYTLHAMMRDGSDIVALSFHETNEWNPSVNRDGMIAYTRWDYVDRDNDISHHLWLCTPDGRDPRSPHGNYPRSRELRPWMELSIRAVPGSNRYVAVAAPHHGYNYGSLVLIDPSLADDGAMNQVRRLTPEAHFPESESAPGKPHKKGVHNPNGETYGSPWPLSEAFHLCVYDPRHSNYGIYLVDCFGNRELIWRDPEIACLDPIPLRPRPRPAVLPSATCQAKADRTPGQSATATVAIANVYDSDFKWPDGAKVAAIRVVQLFPKSTYHLDNPKVGLGSESLARGVVGTAPVESDGSAYFQAPVDVPIYFQALDEQGRAIQSMRSDTYLHAGERLSCVGCHESKQRSPQNGGAVPLAWQRNPSPLQPEAEGSFPISFPRLVQPVLDRHCVECHATERAAGNKKAKDLSGKIIDRRGWSAGFVNLISYAWAWSGENGNVNTEGSRSPAGKIGARASRLPGLLEGDHHGLKLSTEDLRRITLWIDCNSNFYGTYQELKKQGVGERVMPKIR